MKKYKFILLLLLLFIFSFGFSLTSAEIVSASDTVSDTLSTENGEMIDYVSMVSLDMNSETVKAEVTVKLSIDGDTVHFNIDTPTFNRNLLKGRFLAVDTPESTGKIEEYGKAASNFTKEKLGTATSIIIESDDSDWNADSTGDRYLIWVWYKTNESDVYRNLNIELLQNGLSRTSKTSENRYGEVAMNAYFQAKELKLNIHSGKPDPDFYYGEAIELDLRELRTNIEAYNNKKVAFNGVVYRNSNQTAYVESYDEETGIYYGISVYYGYGASGFILDILKVGNLVRIVGKVGAFQGNYQVSGLQYLASKPNNPDNVQKIESGHEGSYTKVNAADFYKDIEIENNGEIKKYSFASLAVNSSIAMDNLQVVNIYTTDNEESSSNGAMTLTCKSGNTTIYVRTDVLTFPSGGKITEKTFKGKNINVKGLVDYFDGSYQIKVLSMNDVTFNGFTIEEPIISIECLETVMVNNEFTPIITVTGNAEYSVDVVLVKPNKTTITLSKEDNYTYNFTDAGNYTILVSVEDVFGKITQLEKNITVVAPEKEGCQGAILTSLFGIMILSGAVLILKKKKH